MVSNRRLQPKTLILVRGVLCGKLEEDLRGHSRKLSLQQWALYEEYPFVIIQAPYLIISYSPKLDPKSHTQNPKS